MLGKRNLTIRRALPFDLQTMSACWETCETPIGRLTLVESAGRLRAVRFPGGGDRFAAEDRRPERLAEAVRQLAEYFAGERRRFELPLELRGSPFQRRVWEELRTIPYGSTVSYGELARRIGRPGEAREVGAAVGRTPVPIVVPCHRVIGADGSLTGYGGRPAPQAGAAGSRAGGSAPGGSG